MTQECLEVLTDLKKKISKLGFFTSTIKPFDKKSLIKLAKKLN